MSYFVVEAVLDFLTDRLAGPAERRILDLGVFPPARALSIEFLKPMAWDDELEIHVGVKELRTHAISFSVVGYLAGEKAFLAELTQVCVSPETKRPVAIPAVLRKALSESYCKGARGLAAEVFDFGPDQRVERAYAHYVP